MLELYLDKLNRGNRRNGRIFITKEDYNQTKVVLDAKLWAGVEFIPFSRARHGPGRLETCHVE